MIMHDVGYLEAEAGKLCRQSLGHDVETSSHVDRVAEYAALFGDSLGMGDEEKRALVASARLHDVGKSRVPYEILHKAAPLTDEEFDIMRMHTLWGYKIARYMLSFSSAVGLTQAEPVSVCALVARHHHENFDGTGYPDRLAGEDIPLFARITKVVDVYDALRQRRSYKPGFSHEKAMRIMLEGDGRMRPEHFDPQLLEIFQEKGDEMNAVFEWMPD